jgi:hypothetical protein
LLVCPRSRRLDGLPDHLFIQRADCRGECDLACVRHFIVHHCYFANAGNAGNLSMSREPQTGNVVW